MNFLHLIKGECLEGVIIIDIYKKVPYNPDPYHSYNPLQQLFQLFQYILKIIIIGFAIFGEIILIIFFTYSFF